MSVDINIYAEKCEDGLWKSCFPVETFKEDDESPHGTGMVYESYVNGGDYVLTRILLIAGRVTKHGFDTSAQPRGLPDDLSPELRALVEGREGIGLRCHFPSWLLLSEVLVIPWDEKATISTGVEVEEICQCCQVFLQHTVPLLKTFGEPDEVRIVFWN